MEEKNVRNKIIALSGEPVSGKGTVTKLLISELQEKGYKKENIHTISTGNEFRKYFNVVLDFIDCLKRDDDAGAIDLVQTQELQDIANNTEYREAFKKSATTIAKNKINVRNLSIEEMNNLPELKEIRKAIDLLIDSKIANIGKEINKQERPDEIWIIDSRLAFHNVPEAFSVRLTANPDVAAKRLLGDTTRGKEDNDYESIEEAKKARENRKLGEQRRYLSRYGVDLLDRNNYDLIIDTSYSDPNDIADTIIRGMEYYKDNKYFHRDWTSPKTLLPMQTERDTLGLASYTLDELRNEIAKKDFLPTMPIEVVEADGYRGIVEGHHRNFAAASLGKTLVPYEIIAKDDERVHYGGAKANQRISSISENNLYGHEGLIEIGEKIRKGQEATFSYEDIYPGIYEKIRNNKGCLRCNDYEDHDDDGDR